MMLTCTTVCVRLCFMYESKHLNVNSCTVWTQWKSTQFYSKFFVWLTSSSSLSASSCHRSCRVRRGEGEGGGGEAGRDVMFQLDYRHLYIWYNNIISIVGNIGFTLFHHFITLYLITASCSSPFPFSSPPPPFLPPSSPHRRPHLVYSPLFLHQLVQVSTHDMFSLHTCCRPAAAPWRITHQITDQVSAFEQKFLYQTRGSHLCVNFWSVCNWSGAQRRSPGSRVST